MRAAARCEHSAFVHDSTLVPRGAIGDAAGPRRHQRTTTVTVAEAVPPLPSEIVYVNRSVPRNRRFGS